MKQAEKELQQIEKYLAVLEKTQIEDIYENMSLPRQELITPVVLPDDRYITAWLNEEYQGMPFDNAGSFYSAKGIRVRSKAEVMIADMLEHYDIPYRYEYPITLNGLGLVLPDFYCLNISSRKEIIWEHFGMMDNIAYANKNIKKIAAYEQNGYYAGDNMIMTFESSQVVLDSNLIKKKIENYLM